MKKIQSLLVIILIGVALPMQGMMRSGTRVAGTLSQRTMQQLPKQTWGQWVRSFLPRSPSARPALVTSSRITSVRTTTSPFSPIQSSAYHTTVPTQQRTLWEGIKKKAEDLFEGSLFGQTQLTPQQFFEKFERTIKGRSVAEWTTPYGQIVTNKRVFDDEDLEKAKKLIENNLPYINQRFNLNMSYARYGSNTALARERSSSWRGTILDAIFMEIFYPDSSLYYDLVSSQNFSQPYFSTVKYEGKNKKATFVKSDNRLNFIKLAQYAIDNGAQISSDLKECYKKEYFNVLMTQYKGLLSTRQFVFEGLDYELAVLDEVFKNLDPLLEKLMPEFKEELKSAKETRNKNHESEFFSGGAFRPKGSWRSFQDDPEFKEYARMEGEEGFENYSSFKASGSADFRSGSGSQARGSTREDVPRRPRKIEPLIWDVLPGVNANSSKQDIARAFRNFMKENHSDKTINLSEDERKKRDEKVNEVTAAWNEYKEQLKQQRAKQKQATE